ncbi:FAD-dependent oxidoreductase [Candidatus Woesearchaeota archaeon]|nr:FAD-dependent oxidoreductase [Candidatus Woesearchaeota archaeon]
MKIGVLGGGLAGMSSAYFLKNHDCEVLEEFSRIGGHCKTKKKNGFSYDMGGHIIFSRDKEILNFMLKKLEGNIKSYYRNNQIWFKKRFVKYPFENGLHALDKEDIFECLYYFVNNSYGKPKTNFKEWIYYTFGKGIAEKYLIPYNKKIWKTDPENLGLDWVEGRVPKPPAEDIIKSAIGMNTEGYTHQLNFWYPGRGGIESLVAVLGKDVKKIILNYKIKKIRKTQSGWIASNGKDERCYDSIVSTMPLPELLGCLDNVPKNIIDAINSLRYNGVIVIMIGLNKIKFTDKFAVYVVDEDILYHRLCFYTFLHADHAPPGKHTVTAELTYFPGDKISRMSSEELIRHVISTMEQEGFIDSGDVVETDIVNARYGYVVNTIGYLDTLKTIRQYFDSIGIHLCGRFAEFEYLNTDAVIRHSFDLARKINNNPSMAAE